jgi:hypothetical protein
MSHSLGYDRFCGLAISFDLTQEHCALYRGNAKIGELFFVGSLGKSPRGFLFNEECRQLILYDFENKAEVLTN